MPEAASASTEKVSCCRSAAIKDVQADTHQTYKIILKVDAQTQYSSLIGLKP